MSKSEIWDHYDDLARGIYEDEELQNDFCSFCPDLTQEWDTGAWSCINGEYPGGKECMRRTEWQMIEATIEQAIAEVRMICRE